MKVLTRPSSGGVSICGSIMERFFIRARRRIRGPDGYDYKETAA